MDRVLARLWIGSSRDLDGGTPLRALGFSAVVDLRDGIPPRDLGVEVHRLERRDGDPWAPAEVERALAFLHEHIRQGAVLVACGAGQSRSASLCVGYLVRTGWDPAEAYRRVRAVRPRVTPVPAMMESVLAAVGVPSLLIVERAPKREALPPAPNGGAR